MQALALAGASAFLAWLIWAVQRSVSNCFFHPLSRFPGPKLAACTTYWKAFLECVLNRSISHELEALHKIYGTKSSGDGAPFCALVD